MRCFELYLRSGELEEDAAAGLLPPHDRTLTAFQQQELWASRGSAQPRFATFRPYPAFHDFGTEEQATEAAARPAGAADTSATTPVAAPAPVAMFPAAAAAAAGLPPPNPQAAVGRVVWRKWEGHGWYEGKVTAHNHRVGASSDHTLVYQAGTPHELVERMDVMNPPVPLCWYNPALRPPPTNTARPLAPALTTLTSQNGVSRPAMPAAINGAASAVAAALQTGVVRSVPAAGAAFAKPAGALPGVPQLGALHVPRTNAARPLLTPAGRSPVHGVSAPAAAHAPHAVAPTVLPGPNVSASPLVHVPNVSASSHIPNAPVVAHGPNVPAPVHLPKPAVPVIGHNTPAAAASLAANAGDAAAVRPVGAAAGQLSPQGIAFHESGIGGQHTHAPLQSQEVPGAQHLQISGTGAEDPSALQGHEAAGAQPLQALGVGARDSSARSQPGAPGLENGQMDDEARRG